MIVDELETAWRCRRVKLKVLAADVAALGYDCNGD